MEDSISKQIARRVSQRNTKKINYCENSRSRKSQTLNNTVIEKKDTFNNTNKMTGHEKTAEEQQEELRQERENFRLEQENFQLEQENLRVEQENLEKLRIEITRKNETNFNNLIAQINELKVANEEQIATIGRLQQEISNRSQQLPGSHQQDLGMNLVNGLVNRMEHIDNEIKMPKYSHEADVHPNEYLEKVEKYFRVKGTNEGNKLEIIERSLEGRVLTWYEANNFENVQQFKTAFLKEFNSIPCQAKLKGRWFKRRYNPQDVSLVTYFYDQLRIAQNFEPKYSEFEAHYHIIQQLPLKCQDLLSTVDYSNKTRIAQSLGNMDVANEARYAENKRWGPNSNNAAINKPQFKGIIMHSIQINKVKVINSITGRWDLPIIHLTSPELMLLRIILGHFSDMKIIEWGMANAKRCYSTPRCK